MYSKAKKNLKEIKQKNDSSFTSKENIFKSYGAKWEPSTFFYALIAGMVALALFNLGYHDDDYLWHSALGRWITENGIPTNDIFSWIGIEKNLPYTAHSWLFGYLMNYLTLSASGDVVLAARFVCFVGAFLLFLITKATFVEKRNTFLLVIAIVIGTLCANPRPQIVSNCLFVLTIYFCEKIIQNKKSKAYIPLFLVGVLWANFHGGTILIYMGLIIFYMYCSLLPNFKIGYFGKQVDGNIEIKENFFKMSKEDKKSFLKKWVDFNKNSKEIFIISFCVLASFLNPYVSRIFTYGFLENNSITKMYISEWQPAALLSVENVAIAITIVLYIIVKRNRNEIVQIYKILPVFFCIIASGIHIRFGTQAIICSILLFCEIINEKTKKKWDSFVWYALSFVFLLISTMMVVSIQPKEGQIYELDSELTEYLEEKEFERPYNMHNDGEKLIYAGQKTFIDQRFTDSLMKDAIEFECLASKEKDPRDYAKEMQFDAIIVNKKSKRPIGYYLEIWEEWEMDFESENYMVYVPVEKTKSNK